MRARLANAFGSTPGKQNWNPNADLDGDSLITVYDGITLASHYGQHYP